MAEIALGSHEPYGHIAPGQGNCLATPALALPASGTKTIFTVYGPIHVDRIVGVVGTALGATATTLKISAKVGTLTAVDICAAGTVTSLAAGTIVMPITSFATALSVAATNGVIYAAEGTGDPTRFIMGGAGIITITTSATDTGTIQWFMFYRPFATWTPTDRNGSQVGSVYTQVLAAAS